MCPGRGAELGTYWRTTLVFTVEIVSRCDGWLKSFGCYQDTQGVLQDIGALMWVLLGLHTALPSGCVCVCLMAT